MVEQLGQYKILDRIGSGGMGEVYRARDTRLGRTVAIKVLSAAVASDPARRERFMREARAAAALSHPNIAALYEVGEDAGDRTDDRDGKELHDHHPRHLCRRPREIEEQRVHGDCVEPVAQLRDRLTDVQEAEVTVLPQQRDVWTHDRAASPDFM